MATTPPALGAHQDLDRARRPLRHRRWAGPAAVVVTLVAAAAAVPALTSSGSALAGTELTALVDRYEQTAPFRGTDLAALPSTAADGFRLGQVVLRPEQDRPASGVVHDGFVDYGAADTGYGIIAASDGNDRDRVGFVLDRPHLGTFAVPAELPVDAVVDHNGSGEITVTGPGGVTTLAPATAVDATGAVVPASYRLSGGMLLVEVDLAEATLPVLVDPATTWHWWGKTEYYSRAEVRSFANWYQATRIATLACRNLGPVCSRTVGRYTSWIANTWQQAKNNGQCLEMSMTYTGQVTSVRAYACNW